jgi:hypothetical protein
VAGGVWIGGFVKVDDAAYQIIRDLNETTKRLAALKKPPGGCGGIALGRRRGGIYPGIGDLLRPRQSYAALP